jgi:hypothetical protein
MLKNHGRNEKKKQAVCHTKWVGTYIARSADDVEKENVCCVHDAFLTVTASRFFDEDGTENRLPLPSMAMAWRQRGERMSHNFDGSRL